MANLGSQTAQSGTAIPTYNKVAADVILQSQTGPLGTQANPIATANLTETSAKGGMSYFASSGAAAVGLNANIRALFTNPAGSGVTAFVKSLVWVNGTSTTLTGNLILNPTTNVPSANANVVNMLLGNSAGACTFKADVGAAMAAGTGTLLSPVMIPSAKTTFDQGPFVVAPGYSLGLNLGFTIAASGEIQIYWTEQSNAPYVAT